MGSKDGLVAIVQNCQDSGLTVTLTDSRLVEYDFINQRASGTPTPTPLLGEYVSSYTQTAPQRSQSHSLVCVGSTGYPYYHRQLAQKRKLQASTSGRVSRMSNRQNVMRVNTNNRASEIGRALSPVDLTRQHRQSTSRDAQNRACNISDDRRISLSKAGSSTLPSRGDSFSESLRKYDIVKRSTSEDLIQRVLTFMQTKNLTRNTYHSSSLRSLRRPSRETRETVVIKRSSKNVQTYTRTRAQSPVNDYTGIYGKVERRRRVNSPVRGCSSPSQSLTSSYDYLRIGEVVPSYSRAADVRYLNDVTRIVRNTIRQIYDDESPVCPQIMSRYREHMRSYHSNEASTATMPTERSQKVQTATRRVSLQLPCRPPVDAFSNTEVCECCRKPLPCDCKMTVTEENMSCFDICNDLLHNIVPDDSTDDECSCDDGFYSVVDDWLREIPVSAYYQPKDKNERERLARNLKIKLKEVEGDDEATLAEIMKCLNMLPMWLPSDQKSQEEFKAGLANKLIQGLNTKKIDRDKYAKYVGDWLRRVPFKQNLPIDKSQLTVYMTDKLVGVASATDPIVLKDTIKNSVIQEIQDWPIEIKPNQDKVKILDDLAEELADDLGNLEFNDAVSDFVDALPIKSNVDKSKLEAELKNKLKNIMKMSSPEDLATNIKKAALEELNKLPFQIHPLQKEGLCNSLADTIVNISAGALGKALHQEIKKDVNEWLAGIPELTPKNSSEKEENDKIVQDLTKYFCALDAKGLSDKEIEDKMIAKTDETLGQVFKDRGKDVGPEYKKELKEKLVDTLKDTAKRVRRNAICLFNTVPGLSDATAKKIEDEILTEDFAKRLTELKDQGLDDKEIKKKILAEINNKINPILDEKGESLDIRAQDQMAEKLFGKLQEMGNKPKLSDKDINQALENAAKKDIEEWLKEIPELEPRTPEEQKENQALVDDLAKTFVKLAMTGLSDDEIKVKMQKEIKQKANAILEGRGKTMDMKTKDKLAERLCHTLEDTLDHNIPADVKEANQIAYAAQHDVKKVLDEIPELSGKTESEQKANEKLTEDLAKTMTELRAKGLNEDDVKNKMQEEIKKKLDNSLLDKGKSLDSNIKEKLANKMLGELEVAAKRVAPDTKVDAKKIELAAKEDVKKLLDNIPELAGNSVSEQKENAKLTRDLAKTLTDLKSEGLNDETLQLKVQSAINKKLDDALADRGKNIDPKLKEQLIQQLQNEFDSAADTVVADKDANLLSSAAKQYIQSVLDNIPELAPKSAIEQKENEKLIDDLAKTFINLTKEGLNDEDFHQKMQQAINEKIDEVLAKRGKSMDPKTKEKLKEQLFNELDSAANTVVANKDANQIALAAKQYIKMLLDNIPELAPKSAIEQKENEKLIDDLAKTFIKLTKEGLGDEDFHQKMQKAINEKIDEVLANRGKSMDPKTKEKLKEQLFNELDSAANTVVANKDGNQVAIAAKQYIKTLLDNIPELAPKSASEQKENEKMVEDLAKTFTKLTNEGLNDEDFHQKMQLAINEKLDKVLANRGKSMDTKTKEKLKDQLYNELDNAANSVVANKDANQVAHAAKQNIKTLLENVPELAPKSASEQKENEKLVEDLAKTFTKLSNAGLNDEDLHQKMQQAINEKLDRVLANRGKSMDPKTKEKLKEQLYNELDNAANSVVAKKEANQIAHAAKQNIKTLLENVPELAPKSASERKDNEKLVEDLAKTFTKLNNAGLNDEDIHQKMQQAINEKLDKVLAKRGKNMDPKTKEKLKDQLYNELDNAANSVVANKDAKQVAHAAKQNIKTLLENVPELAPNSASEQKENEKLVEDLSKTITKLNNAGLNNEDIHQKMQQAINKKLDGVLANRGKSMDPKTKEKLKEQLYNELDNAANSVVANKDANQVAHAAKQNIKTLLENVPELAPKSASEQKENEKLVEDLAKTFTKLNNAGLNDEDLHQKMQQAINEKLDRVLANRGKSMDSKTKEKLKEQLYNELDNAVNSVVANKDANQVAHAAKQNIKTLLENVPELAPKSASEQKENEKLVEDLAKTFTKLNNAGLNDDDLHQKMQQAINEKLDGVLANRGKSMDPKTKEELKEQLLNELDSAANNIVANKDANQVAQATEQKIEKVLNNTPELAGSPFEQNANKKLTRDLAKTIKKLKNEGLNEEDMQRKIQEEVEKKIDTVLNDRGKNMDTKTKEKLVQQLCNEIDSATESGITDKEANQIANAAKQDIKQLLDKTQLAGKTVSEQKANEKLTSDLAKALTKLKVAGLDDEVVEQKMQEEITKKVDAALDARGLSMEPGAKGKLVQQLYNELDSAAGRVDADKEANQIIQAAKGDFKNMLDKIPELAGTTASEQKANEKLTGDLAKTLAKLKAEGLGEEEIDDKMQEEIYNKIGAALNARGVDMDPETKKNLIQQLHDELDSALANVEDAKEAKNIEKAAKEDIKKLLDDTPELADKIGTKQTLNKFIVGDLAKKYMKLKAEGLDDKIMQKKMFDEVMNNLDTTLAKGGESMNTAAKEKLANKILDKLEKAVNSKVPDTKVEANQIAYAAKQEVKKLLDDIPELAGITVADQKENEQLTGDLAKTLAKLKTEGLGDAELLQRMHEEIMKKLEKTLKNRGKSMNMKDMAKVAHLLQNELDTAAEKVLVNREAKQIAKDTKKDGQNFLEKIPEIAGRNIFELRANERLARELARRLAQLRSDGLDDDEIYVKMVNEIIKKLDEICLFRGKSMEPSAKKKLAKRIFYELEKSAERIIPRSRVEAKKMAHVANRHVQKLFSGVPQLAGSNAYEKKANERLSNDLIKMLTQLKDKGLDDDEIQREMYKNIKNEIGATLDNRGKSMDAATVQKLAQQLLGKLEMASDQVGAETEAKSIATSAKNDVQELLDDIQELAARTPSEQKINERLTSDLAKVLTQLRAEGLNDEETKSKMHEEIKKKLGETLDDRGKNMDTRPLLNLAKSFFDKLESAEDRVVTTNDKTAKNIAKAAKQDVKKLFDDAPELAGRTPSQLINLTRDLAKTLTKLQAAGFSDAKIKSTMKDKITNKIDALLSEEGKQMDADNIQKLAEQLLAKLMSAENSVVPAADKAAMKIAKAAKNDVNTLLEDFPEFEGKTPDQIKANRLMTDNLAKALTALQAEGRSDEEIKNQMQEKAKEELDSILDSRHKSMDPKAKDKLIQKLIGKLESTAEKALSDNDKNAVLREGADKQVIKNLVDEIPEFSGQSPSDKNANAKLVEALSKTLRSLQTQGLDGDQIQLKLQEEIDKKLNTTLNDLGKTMDTDPKQKLAQLLCGKLHEKVIRNPAIIIKEGTHYQLEPKSHDVFNDFSELKACDSTELKDNKLLFRELESKLTDMKANGLTDEQIRTMMVDEVKSKVERTLEERGKPIEKYTLGVLIENVLDMLLRPASVKEELGNELEDAVLKLSSSSMQIGKLSKKLAVLVKELHGLDQIDEHGATVREKLDVNPGHDIVSVASDATTKSTTKMTGHVMLLLENKTMPEPPNLYEEKVFQCVEKLPELSSKDYNTKKRNRLFSKELARQLFEIQTRLNEYEDIKHIILKKVKALIQIFMKDTEKYLDVNKVANKLVNMIIEPTMNTKKPNRKQANKIQDMIPNSYRILSNLSVQNIGINNNFKNRKLTSEISFHDLQSKDRDEIEIRNGILKSIKNPTNKNFKDKWITSYPKPNKVPTIDSKHTSPNRFRKSNVNNFDNISLLKVLQNVVLQWLENIPELTSFTLGDKKLNEEGSGNLALHLVILTENLDKPQTQQEMLKAIQEHLINAFEAKGVDISFTVKTNLAYNLLDQVLNIVKFNKIPDAPLEDSSSERLVGVPYVARDSQFSLIRDWFCKIPILSANNKNVNSRMIEGLNVTLQKIQQRSIDDNTKYKDMKKTIIEWLSEAAYQKNYKLDSNSIEKYARNLVETIKPITQQLKRTSSDNINVSHLLTGSDTGHFSGQKDITKRNDEHAIDYNPLYRRPSNLQDVRPVIFGDLRTYRPYEKASSSKTNSSNKYMRNVKKSDENIPNQRPYTTFVEDKPNVYLLEGIMEGAMKNSESKIRLKKKIPEATQLKITNIIAKNLDALMKPNGEKIQQQLVDLLVREAGLKPHAAEELMYLTLRRVQIKFLECGSEEMELLAVLREEFKDLIDELNISEELKSELETYLADLSCHKLLNYDLPCEYQDEEKRNMASHVMQIAGVTRSTAEEFIDDCVQEMRALSSSPTIIKWINLLKTESRNGGTLTLKQQCRLEKQGYVIIRDFILENKGNRKFSDINKLDEVIRTSISNIIDYLARSDLDGPEKRRLMKNELAQALHNTLKKVDVNEQAEELLDRLEYINLKAHQPIFSKAIPSPDNLNTYYASYLINALANDTPEIPTAESTRLDSDARRRRDSEIRKNKRQYERKLEEVIHDWFDRLPPGVTSDDTQYKGTLIDDLVGDIVDTEKYRQLNPTVEVTEAEQLENLKYQCYKWMGKFLEGENLKTGMARGNELVEGIKAVVALPLCDPAERRNSVKSSMGSIQTFQSALQKAVADWIQDLPPSVSPTVDENNLKYLIEDFAGRIEALKGEPDVDEKILKKLNNFLPVVFGSRDKDELNRLVASLYDFLKDKGFADYSWVPTMDTSEFNEENLEGAIQDMIKLMPQYLSSTPQDKKGLEDVGNELTKGLKKTIAIESSYQAIKNELLKHVKNLIQDTDMKNETRYLNIIAENLINHLKSQGVILDEDYHAPISYVVDEWINTMPLEGSTIDEEKEILNMKDTFLSQLIQARQQHHPITATHEEGVKEEIKKFLTSTSPYQKLSSKEIDDKVNELVKLLRYVPLQVPDRSSIKPFKRPADVLFEYVDEWCTNLPIDGEVEKQQILKQSLAIKLINKISELNMNPDIFNDKNLYEDLLPDEISKILDEVPGNPELDKYLPALKKDLISKIMEARERMYNELVGKAYKQQLRDAVSTTLGLPDNLSPDEQASFEILKHKVADAFINLHYSPSLPCNEDIRNMYRKKISDEVDRFCDDVLNHYPCSHIDPDKIKKDLNKALVRNPVPKDDSMKLEVEQSRLKDIVTDWMKEIPLRQETATDRLRRYKLATVLVTNLHELELLTEADPYSDGADRSQEEIMKFLKKLPLVHGQEGQIPDMTQELSKRLLESNESRKFISARRSKSIESRSEVCARYPCTLSEADQKYLKIIKERTTTKPPCAICKESFIRQPLKSTCSQTETSSKNDSKICTNAKLIGSPICTKKDATCMTKSPQIMPQVLVREYIWESSESLKTMPGLSRSCSQGVQSGKPCTVASTGQQTCPYARPNTCYGTQRSVYSPAPQQKSCQATQSLAQPHPLIQPCSQPYNATQPTSQSYTTPQTCSGHRCQTPSTPNSRPQMYYPQEKRTCGTGYYQNTNEAESSGEESQMSHCARQGSSYCKRTKQTEPETEWTDDEFWDTCERHRGMKEVPCSRRRERIEEKTKCRCKDRILVSCKGPSNKNRFHDMCQNCGSTCPHPTNLFFKR